MTSRHISRRRRMGSHEHVITPAEPARPAGAGVRALVIGFAVILLTGTVLLAMPFATEGGGATRPSEALFTAISAICVTGLVVLETQGHWNFFGELVLIVLIQVGGLGYMIGTAAVAWLLGRRLEIRDRHLLRLYYGAPTMSETLHFARNIVIFTAVIEVTGALVLYPAFVAEGVGPGTSVWWSIFHAVSAFNNAGFSLTGADMTHYQETPHILGPLSVLIILGGLGALPVLALMQYRSFGRLPLDFKLIFVTTAILLMGGTLVVAALEWTNPATFGEIPPAFRPLDAFFHTTVSRTAGFSSVDVGDMRDQTLLATILLMFIGGATGSTAGGIKVGTFALLVLVVMSTLRGRDEVTAFGRRIPSDVPIRALAIVVIMGLTGFATVTVLAELEQAQFLDLFFEATSAVGTTGLSTGVTASLSDGSRAAIMATMLLGRFGPPLLVLYMIRPRRERPYRYPKAGVRLG